MIQSLDPAGIIGVYAVDENDDGAAKVDNTEAELALQTKLSISAEDFTLGGIVDFVRAGAGVNLVANWQALELVGVDKNTSITLHTKEVTAQTLLELTLEQASADAFDDDKAMLSLEGGVVRVSTIRDLNRRTITRIYDIGWFARPNGALAMQLYRDNAEAAKLVRFVFKPENPLSRRLEDGCVYCALCSSVTKPDGTTDCHSYQTRIDQLVDIIHTNVGHPDEWLDEESIITDLDKQLVIRTTAAKHDAILALMRSMRHAQTQAFAEQAREIEVALLLKQAESHRLKQEDSKALRLIDRALRLSPSHPEARVLRQIVIDASAK